MEVDQRQFPLSEGDLNIYHARLIADQQITYILDFSDRLEVDRLQAGLAVLVAALPILACAVRVEGVRFRWVSGSGLPPSLEISSALENAEAETLKFITAPCNPEKQSPLKNKISPHSRRRPALL